VPLQRSCSPAIRDAARAAAGAEPGSSTSGAARIAMETRPYDGGVLSDAACAVLTESFFDDPVLRHIVPEDAEYAKATPAVFWWFLWSFSVHDMIDCAVGGRAPYTVPEAGAGELLAVTLWEPAAMTCGYALRFFLFVVVNLVVRFRKFVALGKLLLHLESKRHQHAPTAYHLQFIGTATAAQGKGVGTQLLKVGLDRADSAGLCCYLESSNPRNVPFYKRNGFVTVEEYYPFEGEAGVDGRGPVITMMLRQPGGGT
jgi:ribosomal protein S18 acetylase RimI-like enzyme